MSESLHILSGLCGSKPRPLIMGILNITEDSFSDGNKYIKLQDAIDHAKKMINDGADLIDVGGESTRPGSLPISVEKEIERVVPLIKAIRDFSNIPLSIDTRKGEVAQEAISYGANIINNVDALGDDLGMIDILRENPNVGYIIMHMRGNPYNMQENPFYNDVVADVTEQLRKKIEYLVDKYISKNRLLIDPGIGFGKTFEHNLKLLANVSCLKDLKLPIVIGASRKRFIDAINPSEPDERLGGSLAVTALCIREEIDLIRVHDVKEHVQFIQLVRAIDSSK